MVSKRSSAVWPVSPPSAGLVTSVIGSLHRARRRPHQRRSRSSLTRHSSNSFNPSVKPATATIGFPCPPRSLASIDLAPQPPTDAGQISKSPGCRAGSRRTHGGRERGARVARSTLPARNGQIARRLLTWPAQSPGSGAPSLLAAGARRPAAADGARCARCSNGTSGPAACRVRCARRSGRAGSGRSWNRACSRGRPGTPRPAPLARVMHRSSVSRGPRPATPAACAGPRVVVHVRPDGSLVAFDDERDPAAVFAPKHPATLGADSFSQPDPSRVPAPSSPTWLPSRTHPLRQVRRNSKPEMRLTDSPGSRADRFARHRFLQSKRRQPRSRPRSSHPVRSHGPSVTAGALRGL